MLQFVDRDTYKNAIINPERAILLYIDNENKISLQADIELGGDPVNYRVELMDFELDSTKPILLSTVECRGFYCGGINFITITTCTARKVLKGFSDCCSGFQMYFKACYFLVGIYCDIAYISVNKRSVDFLTVNVFFRRFQYGFDFCKLFFHLSLVF